VIKHAPIRELNAIAFTHMLCHISLQNKQINLNQKEKVMLLTTKKEKVRFWRNWTLLNALVLIFSYIISLFVMLLIAETIFGFSADEWGTPFQQTVISIAAGIVIGISIGFTQWRLLRKVFNVSSFWLYSVAIGFIIIELIAGIILWKLDINRGELNFIEGDPYSHAIILAITGLLISIIQMPLLRNHFYRIIYWVVASTVAWGIGVLLTAIDTGSEVGFLLFFILGTLLYSAITGATLIWIMQPKELKS